MNPDYKQVKTIAEFCPVCKERLSGNNSIAFPWRCKCGTWKHNFLTPMEYTIEPRVIRDKYNIKE